MASTFAAVLPPEAVIDDEGNAMRGVSIPVYLYGTNTLAVLYSDFDRTTTAPNPVICTDANLSFFADPGRYEYVLPDGARKLVVLYADPNEPGGIGGAFSQFLFPVPTQSWTIHHNLGRHPALVQAQDPTGTPVGADVSHIDANTTVINFATAFAGSAWVG